MRLKNRIIYRVSTLLLVILTLWSLMFYWAMMEEITDEVDDALDLYAELVMTHFLAGKELPSTDNGTNNSYHLRVVSKEYADNHLRLSYSDETLYIEAKRETEPARVLRMIFNGADGQFNELTVITPTIEKQDLRKSIAFWILGLYIAVVLTIIVVNAWVLSRSMRPLYRLLDWLDAYHIGKQNKELDNPTNVTEFKTLNDAVIRFSHRNNELFEQQKRFIGDASHELQTPLAICQNRLEMLCNTDLNESQLKEVIKTLQTLEHLSELNRSLLLLSKIDNEQFPETQPIEMAQLIHQAQSEYRSMAASRGVAITLCEEGTPTWTMNPALAKALIHNLCRNAIIHNITGGTVEIRIEADSLTFANTGTEAPLEKEQIFNRFYKSANGNKNETSGLGLAIVAAIARLYHLNVEYEFKENKHFFSIKPKKNSK